MAAKTQKVERAGSWEADEVEVEPTAVGRQSKSRREAERRQEDAASGGGSTPTSLPAPRAKAKRSVSEVMVMETPACHIRKVPY